MSVSFSVYRFSCLTHPVGTRRWILKRVKFLLRGYLYRKQLIALWQVFQSPTLNQIIENGLNILEKIMRPYLHSRSKPRQRVEMLVEHYSFVERHLSDYIGLIYLGEGVEFGRYPVSDDSCGEYKIVLRHDGTFRREGDLVVSIVNDAAQRIYSCAFSLTGKNGDYTLTIGALQGPEPSVCQPTEVIKYLTKIGFGMRPKNVVVDAVFALAKEWHIKDVMAVAKSNHVFQAKRYSKKQKSYLLADYDQVWGEYNGVRTQDGFFKLSPPERKSFDEIPSKRRSMYRHRFYWLDYMAESIRMKLSAK